MFGMNVPPFVSSADVKIGHDSDVCSLGFSFKCKCEKTRKKSSLKAAYYWAADISQSCRTNQMTREI